MTETHVWPDGRKGAISCTYDDALPCHYEIVAPAWEAHGLQVTFYTHITRLMDDPGAWRDVAGCGHELGNHSIFHPCRKHGRLSWLADEYDLRTYTPRRWTDEMAAANAILASVDGRRERSYGNNCCNTEIGDGGALQSIEPLVEQLFVAARGGLVNRVVDPAAVNFNALGHFSGDGRGFAELREEVDAAVAVGGWIIYMIHGVGAGTHSLNMDPDVHRALVDYVSERRDVLWAAPVATVARHLRAAKLHLARD